MSATLSTPQPAVQYPIEKVVLIPGFCEPRFLLWPLQHSLRRHCDDVKLWRDRMVFRNLDRSVARLKTLLKEPRSGGSIALVTHSFGDWVARRAIAESQSHPVSALVSIAPVFRAGLVPTLLHQTTCNLIPEVAVMGDPVRASCNSHLDQHVRRLVIWATVDAYVRPVDFDVAPLPTVHRLTGTHMSVAMQPNSLRLIEQFLFAPTASP